MSKEFIKPEQFCHSKSKANPESVLLTLNDEQQREIAAFYEDAFDAFRPGRITTGKVIRVDSDGILVDVDFKSRGMIPKFEFGPHELKNFKKGQDIDVLIDNLEDSDGNIVLSYEKAKAMRAWDAIVKLFDDNKPVEGIVTHKVKGGLSVDIGIPAFLPGSQIDLQRVTDFDQYVGQTITASILKVNQKRGNVIISRRKYMGDLRADVRKDVLDKLKETDIIHGIVKNITNYGVFIDIGGVDGLLHITDMTWGRIAHPSEMVKLGDRLTVKVLSFDRNNEKISLGLKQLSENPWEEISKELHPNKRITGTISSVTDYGLFIEVAPGIEGLVHISEISWTDRISDLKQRYKVGDKVDVLVVSVDPNNRRMSLSIKQLDKNPWDSVEEQFKPGQKIKGNISNITDFGIFVQLLPGIDGLVHISDLSWTEHIGHPSDRYAIGQEVEAIVLAIDKNSKKISLGIKQLSQDPWEHVEQQYPLNSVINGEVSKIANFGAFVKLDTGIEGLIHNTTLASEQSGKKASDLFTVGQKVELRVVNVNRQERKLGLSTRLDSQAAQPSHAQPMSYNNAPSSTGAAKPKARRTTSSTQKDQPQQQQRSGIRSHTSQNEAPASNMKSSLQMALEGAMKKHDDENSGE
jgi:small subunit ribosomal protein S1